MAKKFLDVSLRVALLMAKILAWRAAMRRTFLLVTFVLLTALAFAGQGWYLLQPTGSKAFPAHEVARTPIRGWDHVSSYDTAEACEQRKLRALNFGEKGLAKAHLDVKQANTEDEVREQRSQVMEWVEMLSTWRLSRCIGSDDPRLK